MLLKHDEIVHPHLLWILLTRFHDNSPSPLFSLTILSASPPFPPFLWVVIWHQTDWDTLDGLFVWMFVHILSACVYGCTHVQLCVCKECTVDVKDLLLFGVLSDIRRPALNDTYCLVFQVTTYTTDLLSYIIFNHLTFTLYYQSTVQHELLVSQDEEPVLQYHRTTCRPLQEDICDSQQHCQQPQHTTDC